MHDLISISGQIIQILTALTAIYFCVGLVVNLAQAQFASGTGDSLGYARALQQAVVMVVLLVLTASAPAITESLQDVFGKTAETAAAAVSIWRALAQSLIGVVVGGVIVYSVVVSVWSSVSAQAGMLMGSAAQVRTAVAQVWKILLGVIAMALVMGIANRMIGLLFP